VRKSYARPFWLIVKYRTGGMEVLRIKLASGEETLPVFSFEDEARMFFELGTSDGWRVRETAAGELISILFGPCAGVRKVALDPLPDPDVAALAGLVSMGREAFMESLLNMQRLPSYESGELEGILEERQLTRAVADDATQTLQ
jgi:hypothetical protein